MNYQDVFSTSTFVTFVTNFITKANELTITEVITITSMIFLLITIRKIFYQNKLIIDLIADVETSTIRIEKKLKKLI